MAKTSNKSVQASGKATTGPSRGTAPSTPVPAMKKGGVVKMKKGGKC